MSSVRALALLCIALMSAQSQDRAAYRARVDTLLRRYYAAQAEHQGFLDSSSGVQPARDTLVIGPLRVALLAPRHAELARRSADSALRILQPTYGRSLDALRRYTLRLREEPPQGKRPLELVLALIDDEGRETRARWGEVSQSILTMNFRDVMVQVLSDAALYPASSAGGYDPAPLRAWLQSSFPVDTPLTSEYRAVRTELLTSGITIARRCYDRDISSCRRGMYIDTTTDPATQWFDSAGRVAFLRRDSAEFRRAYQGRDFPDRMLAEGCLRGRDADCIAILRAFPSPGLPEPLPAMARLQLLRLALGAGGERSIERATMTAGDIETRLAAAANMPVDSLFTLWLDRVHGSDVGSKDMSTTIALSSLFWAALSLGLATRSSRWR